MEVGNSIPVEIEHDDRSVFNAIKLFKLTYKTMTYKTRS